MAEVTTEICGICRYVDFYSINKHAYSRASNVKLKSEKTIIWAICTALVKK